MFSSIRSRLLLTYFLIIVAILGVVTVALLIFIARNPRLAREAEIGLTAAADAIQRQPIELNGRDSATIQSAVDRADNLLNARLAAFSPDGTLLADSRSNSEASIPPQVAQPHPPNGPQIAEFTDESGKTWIYTTRLLDGNYLLIVTTPRPRAPLVAIFTDDFFKPLMRAGLLALGLALVLAFFMTRWITDPLQRVSAAARGLAQGRMKEVLPEGPAELRALANTFNEMGREVQEGQQSQKDFVANISHELRTPLTSIQGFAQAMLDGTVTEKAQVKRSAQVIYDEAGRMHRLVLDLIDLARWDAGGAKLELRPIKLNHLLNGVVEKLAPQALEANIKLEMNKSEPVTAMGDYDRLVQIFTNLVDNALQHAPQGGRVALSLEHDATEARIVVADTGPGIPAAEAKRIFERFYQVDKSRKNAESHGAGLGLSIAQQIIQAHGGKISLESERGKGSRFIVLLPLKSEEPHL